MSNMVIGAVGLVLAVYSRRFEAELPTSKLLHSVHLINLELAEVITNLSAKQSLVVQYSPGASLPPQAAC